MVGKNLRMDLDVDQFDDADDVDEKAGSHGFGPWKERRDDRDYRRSAKSERLIDYAGQQDNPRQQR
jgi:hypothetical protein